MLATLVVAVAVIGIFLFTKSNQKATTTEEAMKEEVMVKDDVMMQEEVDGAMMEGDDVMMKEEDAMTGGDTMMEEAMMGTGSYEVYSADKIAKANDGKVVLFFKASWCPTCRALDADIKAQLKTIPADVTILEVDYDKYKDLRQKYGVTTQHTLVQVDGAGNSLAKWNGSLTLATLLPNIK